MKITHEQAERLEIIHNVYIDAESMDYNHDGYDAIYGWAPIPEQWLADIAEPCGETTMVPYEKLTEDTIRFYIEGCQFTLNMDDPAIISSDTDGSVTFSPSAVLDVDEENQMLTLDVDVDEWEPMA